MKIGLFGGSFDPVHLEHVRFVFAAIEQLGLDKVIVIPSFVAPHKLGGARADAASRFAMCRLAFRNCLQAEVSDYELSRGETSYTYITCRYFAEKYPDAERYFLMGADMLEDFFTWKNPADILQNVTLAVCDRGDGSARAFSERFESVFCKKPCFLGFCGAPVSSTRLRVALAFGKPVEELDEAVSAYLREHSLYEYPVIARGLALEKEKRREHSYRVACLACARARGAGISEEKALLAAALHDCGKYVPMDSPLLSRFVPPCGVPDPVMHQFTGAYLAERLLGICDEEILNAIRYHTSGRAEMGALEKLIFLSDLLEEGRNFPGVEELRALFFCDLDKCLFCSLSHQIAYLEASGGEIYPLTGQAYEWIRKKFEK